MLEYVAGMFINIPVIQTSKVMLLFKWAKNKGREECPKAVRALCYADKQLPTPQKVAAAPASRHTGLTFKQYKTSLLGRLRADPSRCISTNRQNPPIQNNRCNF